MTDSFTSLSNAEIVALISRASAVLAERLMPLPLLPASPALSEASAEEEAEEEAEVAVEAEEEPDATSYRLPAGEIDDTRCVGRHLDAASVDRRWTPHVYRETQCSRAPVPGPTGLCKICVKRQEKAVAASTPVEAARTGWNGVVVDEPPEWTHMLGTAWAKKKKLVFTRSRLILATPAATPL